VTYRVAGLGEILWDRFSDGDRMGGASANFAFHAGQLGAVAQIVSRLGRDTDGDRLFSALEKRGISTEFIQRDSTYPTGLVRVELKEGQPTYLIEGPAAWDFLEFTDKLKQFASRVDAVCFGTLAQRGPASRGAIQSFIRSCPEPCLRLFDINLRQDFFSAETIDFGLTQATALKLNGDELMRLAGLLGWPKQPKAALAEIFKRHPVDWIAVTHGADGCEIHTRNESIQARAPHVRCLDAVGAGDAFSAALVVGILKGLPLAEIAERANCIGAYVASQAGGMPVLPEEYKIG